MTGAVKLTEVDFEEIKQNLINYLKSTKQFTDFDFEGSNLSVILNLLAYQSQLNAYSTNMIANESFLSSASIRDNVVSNAKSVGYIPTSSKSSQSTITFRFQLTTTDFPSGFPSFLEIRPGMVFSTNTGNANYIFNFIDAETAPVSSTGICAFEGVTVYEGTYLDAEFTVDTSNYNQKFVLENRNIDTSLIRVEVQENPNQEARTFYEQANNLVETTSESAVYWIEEVNEEYYELTFGDGYFGKKLQNGAKVFVNYIVSNGSGANGIIAQNFFSYTGSTFTSDGAALNQSATVVNASDSFGGAEIETVEEIKFRAPKYYAAQNRAVVSEDYRTLVQNIYPAAADVYVYGGEELSIPEYGRVFIAIKPNTGASLSNLAKNSIIQSLNAFRVGSLEVIITDPDLLFIELDTIVYYDDRKTIRDNAGIISEVQKTLNSRSVSGSIDKFGGAARFSRIVSAIDAADPSITRNTTEMKMRKDVEAVIDTPTSYEICFEQSLEMTRSTFVVESSKFKILDNPNDVYFKDNTNGKIFLYYMNEDGQEIVVNSSFGTVDYETGDVQIGYTTPVTIVSTSKPNNIISVKALPLGQDIIAKKSVYLDLDVENSRISAIIDSNVLSS